MPVAETEAIADDATEDTTDSGAIETGSSGTEAAALTGNSNDEVSLDANQLTGDETSTGTAATDDQWRKPYEELGFENVESPEQAQQRLVKAYQREREERAAAQRQAEYYQSLHTTLARHQQPTADTTPTQSPASSGAIDSLASKWIDVNEKAIAEYVVTDENGNTSLRTDTPDEVRRQIHQFREQKMQWGEVLADPRRFSKAIDERISAAIGEQVTGVISSREQQIADRTAEDQFFHENPWLFETDPVTGTPSQRPTREGQVFAQFLRQAVDAGVSSRASQLRFAKDAMDAHTFRTQQNPTVQRQQTQVIAQQNRMAMLGQNNPAAPSPTTAAGISNQPATVAGTSRMSRMQRLVAELQDEGYDL